MAVMTDKKEAITQAFIKLTGRKPSNKELSILLEQQEKELKKFTAHTRQSKRLAKCRAI